MTKMTLTTLSALLLAFSLLPTLHAQSASPQEALKQYVADLQKNPDDYALRERIIKHVQTMKPTPAIPEEARRYFIRAATMQKEAKDAKGFESAARSYNQALLIAPWWPEAYYNFSMALDQSGQFDGAIKALQLYIMTDPAPVDARAAQDRIYANEAKKEMAAKESSPEAMAAKKQKEDDEWLRSLDGVRFVRSLNYGSYVADVTLDIRGNKIVVGQIPTWIDPEWASSYPYLAIGVWMPWNLNGQEVFTITGRKFIVSRVSVCNGGYNCSETGTISDDGEIISYSFNNGTGIRSEVVYRRQR